MSASRPSAFLSVLPFLSMFTFPAVTVASAWAGGLWLLAPPVLLYVLLPLLDRVLGPDRENREPAAPTWVYRLVPRLFVPVQLATAAFLMVRATQVGPVEAVALVLVGGLAAVVGINVAHELMHRAGRLDHSLSVVLMSMAGYPHFVIEHVHGHHRHVATALDPASSRLGEGLWAYLPRTLAGGLRSAWTIERNRTNVSFGWGNRVVRWWALLLGALLVGVVVQPVAAAWFVGQAVVATVILECINYVEHYGLARREVAPGRFERTRPHHSWNSPERVTNWYTLNLQRHSDHHAYAGRPYELLRHHDDAPQLPAGYPLMMLLALVPPLWFRVMNPRVEALGRAAA